MCFRMSQLLRRPVALPTQFFFAQHAANDYGKMTDVIHFEYSPQRLF
jgi:hypothetical protein